MIKKILPFIVVLILIVLLVSLAGVFFGNKIYEHENEKNQQVMFAWDLTSLFFLVPTLVICTFMALKKNRFALLFLSGVLLYVVYHFMFYSFGLRFNQIFLLYCCGLGMSFYLFIYTFLEFYQMQWDDWFDENVKVTGLSIFLIVMGALFYSIWLSDAIPSSIAGVIPSYAQDLGYHTSTIHVIDLCLVLPLFFMAAFYIKKRKIAGVLLGVSSSVFIASLALYMTVGAIYEAKLGHPLDVESLIIFPALMLGSIVILNGVKRKIL